MTTLGGVLAALGGLFALVLVGSILPVLPTGAAVSATAVLAAHPDPLPLLAVVIVGAVGAYLGDVVTFVICRAGGEALTRRLGMLRRPVRLTEPVRERLRTRPVPALLVARLVPGGRIPVLLASAMAGLPWRRFVTANVPACALWSVVYAAIGLLGRSVFREPWQGVVAAVLLVLVVTQLAGWLRRRHESTAQVEART